MRQKLSSEPQHHTTFVTDAEELQNGNAEESPTMAPQSLSQPTTVDARPMITPIIVTLSSRALAVSLLNAKIKMEKMHKFQLCADWLAQANASPPLPHSLININELLPTDLHCLRISARTEAKKKGFITYVRQGIIYIKKKKEDHATLISTAA